MDVVLRVHRYVYIQMCVGVAAHYYVHFYKHNSVEILILISFCDNDQLGIQYTLYHPLSYVLLGTPKLRIRNFTGRAFHPGP